MKAYLITYDALSANLPGVHTAITTAKGVLEWWHYLSGAYIVTTNLPVDLLKQNLEANGLFGGNYLIIEVHRESDGLLPPAAWDWINSKIGV